MGTDNFDYYIYTLLNTDHIIDGFLSRYKNRKSGRKAYPPELLLRIIFNAYYRGITLNRVIAKMCETDLTFISLAVGTRPHFTTIANFVSSNCKSTIQGMTYVTAADDKNRIIIEAQAYGVGQEQVALKPMVEKIQSQFKDDVFAPSLQIRVTVVKTTCKTNVCKRRLKIRGGKFRFLLKKQKKLLN